MEKDSPDPLMVRVRAIFEESQLTLDELGRRMGYAGLTSRASAWQFLNRTNDPRLSMLRKFSEAVGVPLPDLFASSSNSAAAKKKRPK
jgi:transcriptional regulator with XRE-family HTH domain